MRGGFLPVFYDVPSADTHAVENIGAVVEWLTERCTFHADAKSSLTVLHNRNDMTNLFRASNWVSESKDSIVSRGVTTCAGMTAHTVIILAQTRVGFLTGDRKKSFLDLPQDEQTLQLEKAYARATVAITRARHFALSWALSTVSVITGSPELLLRMWYDPIRSLRRPFFLAFVSCSCHTACVLMKLESDTGRGCQSRQEDGQSAVVLFAHVSGHP